MGGSSNGWLHRIHKFRPTLWFCRLAGWLAALSPTESRYAGVWQSVLNVSDDTAYKLQKCCSIGKPCFQLARSMRDAQGHHHPHHWLQCGDCGVQEPWTSLHGCVLVTFRRCPVPSQSFGCPGICPSPCGTSEDRTRSAHCGDTTTKARGISKLPLSPARNERLDLCCRQQ